MAHERVGLASSRRGPWHVRPQPVLPPTVVFTHPHPRPVAWSSSSIIFTAHPTQPIIVGRLFPSSKQFFLVSPDPIIHSPASYAPPTVISVSSNDHWLFAFFPGRDSDGIACLWNRRSCLDAWIVKDYWPFSRGAAVIACAWAGSEREVCRPVRILDERHHSFPTVVNCCRWLIISSSIPRPTYPSLEPYPPACHPGTSPSRLLSPHLCSTSQNVVLLFNSTLLHCRGSTTPCHARHSGWSKDIQVMHLCSYRLHLRR